MVYRYARRQRQQYNWQQGPADLAWSASAPSVFLEQLARTGAVGKNWSSWKETGFISSSAA